MYAVLSLPSFQEICNLLMLCILFVAGRKITIITDTFEHEIHICNVTLISLCSTPMSRFLEALNSDELDLSAYNLFVIILGYNDLKLDRHFFMLYYKHILDTLQRQSPMVKFIVSILVSDLAVYKMLYTSKELMN